MHRPCQSGVEVLPYPCKYLVHEPDSVYRSRDRKPLHIRPRTQTVQNLFRIATSPTMPPAGRQTENIFTLFLFVSTGRQNLPVSVSKAIVQYGRHRWAPVTKN